MTNFSGNAVATVLVAHWTGGLDRPRLDRVLAGDDPFDETTMVDDHGYDEDGSADDWGVDEDGLRLTGERTPEPSRT